MVFFATLLFLLILFYWINDSDVLSPSFIFCASFVFAAGWVLAYSNRWNYSIGSETFWVIVGGVLLFGIVGTGIHIICSGKNGESIYRKKGSFPEFEIPPILWIAFLLIQVAILLLVAKDIQSLYPAGNVFDSIAQYKVANTFSTESKELHFPLGQLRRLCLAGGYIQAYCFAETLARRKFSVTLFASYCTTLLLSLEDGGRTGAVGYVYCLVFAFLLQRRVIYGRKNMIKPKHAAFVIVLVATVVAVFPYIAAGRLEDASGSPFDYLATYCGAEIPNLDHFLTTSGQRDSSIWGYMTLIRSNNYIGIRTGIDSLIYTLDLPFLYNGSFFMGNVYTTFYAFIYDFGLFGVFVCTALMAVVAQLVYERAIAANGWTDLWTAIASFASLQLMLSFFSNKFYEDFFSLPFILNTFVYLLVFRIVLVLVSRLMQRGNAAMSQLSS